MLAFALSLCFTFKAFAANMSPDYKCCVMGPLEKVDNWSDFKKQLITLKIMEFTLLLQMYGGDMLKVKVIISLTGVTTKLMGILFVLQD